MRPVLAVLLCACGGGDGTAADAGSADGAGCVLPPGEAYVLSSLSLLRAGEGFDLDCDGTVDNSFGAAPDGFLTGFDQGSEVVIESGELIVLLYVRTEPELRLNLLHAHDYDAPPDPTDNLGGQGQFLVVLDQLDLDCQPENEASEVTLTDGLMTASFPELVFPVTTGEGSIDFEQAQMEVGFTESLGSGRLGGIMTLCSLASAPMPGTASGTILDVLVNDPSVSSTVLIDFDGDGDGLEAVEGDGVSILRCVDGDGTAISGSDCPCHPNMADGYSVALQLTGVPAEVLGVIEAGP